MVFLPFSAAFESIPKDKLPDEYDLVKGVNTCDILTFYFVIEQVDKLKTFSQKVTAISMIISESWI